MPSLPDPEGTDEGEPDSQGVIMNQGHATTEQDPSMLAEEFGREKSDVGQRLSRYAGKQKRDSTKQRYASAFSF